MSRRVFPLALAVIGLATVGGIASAGAETPLERGRYLVDIMDCGGCHTTGALVGKPKSSIGSDGIASRLHPDETARKI